MRRSFSRCRVFREDRGLSLFDLAVLSGLSVTTCWRGERGDVISGGSQQKIAKALGVSPAEIFDQPDSRQSR